MLILLQVLFSALSVFAAEDGQSQKSSVQILEFSKVRMNEPIRLSQIASFNGVDPELEAKLNAVVIYEGLGKDGVQEVSNQQIVGTLRSKLSFADLQKVTFKVPTVVRLTGSRSHIYETELKQQVQLQGRSLCGQDCIVDVEDFHLPLISAQTEVIAYKLETRGLKQAGSFVLPLVVETSKGRQNLWVTGQARMKRKALVALRMLNPGDKVRLEDFRQAEVDVSLAKDGVPNEDQIEGRIVARPLRVDQPVFFSDLKLANAAERGEPIKIILGDDVFEVSMMGVAEQSGTIGQAIRVRTVEKKILMGELIEDRVVRVK